MRRLYGRIALGVIFAAVPGWVAVTLLVPRIAAFFQEDMTPGGNLSAIAARLEGVPQQEWPNELRRLQQRSAMSLRVVSGEDLLVEARNRNNDSVIPPVPETADLPALYMPLHGGSHFLIAVPLRSPPLTPILILGLVFVFVLTAAASAIVGIPLVRRLQRLQQAVGELGGGNWAMRLDANAEGALGELAESINRMAAQLHEQFQEREALLQTVSHEMGTPLARMRFQLELFEAELWEPSDRQRLAKVNADLDELDELSTELVSWMEPARNERKGVFKLAPIVDSLIELECLDKGNRVRVQMRIPRDLELTADLRQFQRVMENLLRNALRYAQSTIVVEAGSSVDGITIEVRDDGPGISQEHRLKVLEPFVRLGQPSTQPHHRGVGLGLAIVRRIVEAHGGSITISEAEEGGTLVRTTWPRSAHGERRRLG
jgi:two-component system, OmpR family, sensor histidine kinase RstB